MARPHVLGLRADRQVYRQGILLLSALSGILLLVSAGQVAVLVPLFAIGVFIGFALSQAGMVRRWQRKRGQRWRVRLAINAAGAMLTAAAAVVVSVEKFTDGAWLVVLVVEITRLTEAALGTALLMGRDVLAVHVVPRDEAEHGRDLAARWLALEAGDTAGPDGVATAPPRTTDRPVRA